MATEDFKRELTRHIADLRRSARSMSRNAGIAEELVNETVCAGLRLSDRYAPGTNMSAWLYTIQLGLFRNMLRRRRIRDRYEGSAPEDVGFPPPQTRRADALTRDQVEALRLVAYEGLNYAEAADALGCRMGTVQSRVSRARAALARAMDAEAVDACPGLG